MGTRTVRSVLTAVILWTIIAGGMAATVRYFVLPKYKQNKQEDLTLKTSSAGKYKFTVRLAADNFSGYCIFRSPEMDRRLSQTGIKLSVVDDGADYMKRIRTLSKGEVEMAVFPISSFVQCGAQIGEYPASIIYVIDETQGADAIIAFKNSVSNINALNSQDARIVLTPDSPSEFLARVMIASFNLPNLSKDKWIVKANGSSEVYNKFRAEGQKKNYAYAMWEPDVSKALKNPNAHVLLDSSKVKGYIVDVLVARRDFLINNGVVAREVIENYARTVYANQSKMADVVLADAHALGDKIEESDARQMVKGIQWKNTLENYAHFGLQGSSHSIENIEDIIIKITDVLVKTGALDKSPLENGMASLYYNKLVSDMKKNDFHPGREINVIAGMDTGSNDEQIRAGGKLVKLSDDQWKSIKAVGELRANPINFGRGTSRINVQSRNDLEALAGMLKSWPQYYLTVIGRVRPGGNAEESMQLAKDRAEATVQMLVEMGVVPERMRSLSEISTSDSADAQSVSFAVGQLPY